MMFQFHNGTINTVWVEASINYYAKFQFHNGTINTSLTHSLTFLFSGFNSTTVQLIQLV